MHSNLPPNPFSGLLNRLVDLLVIITGWWLVALSILTCVEMVGRKLFSFSFQGIDEVGGYTLAITAAIGFSYTLITRGHTRIDFLVGKLPEKARSAINVLAMLTLAGMAVFAIWRAWVVLSESIEFQSHSTTPLQTPMWIPQSLWFMGWALFTLVCVYLAGHALVLWLRGDHAAVNKAYGPQTLEEEIESEAGEVLEQVKMEQRLAQQRQQAKEGAA
ncbi:TRAP transporter small permease subunit [Uliginosibacterium sp. H1]|uniref:TRAP transporter small permease subunit n=1 Tax=Uliginosibacterium sp. H1 TaxID=3114757 RepID=UPI002E17F6E4|nr:TRAP transporter small permease [Uliginosibacterium sp. H1]